MNEISFEEKVKSNLDGLLSLSQDNKLLLESILVHQILILSKIYNVKVEEVKDVVYQEVLRKVNLTGVYNMINELQTTLTKSN